MRSLSEEKGPAAFRPRKVDAQHVFVAAKVGCDVFLTCTVVRRDHPDIDSSGKQLHKYVASLDRHHLFFQPGVGPLLSDPAVLAVFVEAEKSVLALTAAAVRTGRRVVAIGLGGCLGWRGRIGDQRSPALPIHNWLTGNLSTRNGASRPCLT